jgi:hypothetical protein
MATNRSAFILIQLNIDQEPSSDSGNIPTLPRYRFSKLICCAPS